MTNSASSDAKKSLVLIVGAGASHEVNLPLGSKLKDQISTLLNFDYQLGLRLNSGDQLIEEAFKELASGARENPGDIGPYIRASWRIRDAMPQAISIDNFIDAHRSDSLIATCSKLAIARSILQAESKSLLFIDQNSNQGKLRFKAVEDTWFNRFFQTLTENCQHDNLDERFSKTAIICFNYDRCIEHYLNQSLQNYYGMNGQYAASALDTLEIFHPYGIVGELPRNGVHDSIHFGKTPTPKQLISLSQQIRTFTEGSDEKTTDVTRMRAILSAADRIAFLGFAFHRLNVELLFPQNVELLFPQQEHSALTRIRRVFATGVGISDPDSRVITEELVTLGGLNRSLIHIARNVACAGLFEEFRRSLSFR